MKTKETIYNFDFKLIGYGHYALTYTSPITEKKWTSTINDMTLIDSTKNSDYPKIKDLEKLKRICKN